MPSTQPLLHTQPSPRPEDDIWGWLIPLADGLTHLTLTQAEVCANFLFIRIELKWGIGMEYSSDLGVSVLVYVPQLKFNKAATKPLEQNGSLIGPYFVKKKSVFSHNLFNNSHQLVI